MERRANGAAISTIRKALGMQQGALAEKAGITSAYLSQIEHGDRFPPLDTITRLANELGVTVDSISYPHPVAAPEQATA